MIHIVIRQLLLRFLALLLLLLLLRRRNHLSPHPHLVLLTPHHPITQPLLRRILPLIRHHAPHRLLKRARIIQLDRLQLDLLQHPLQLVNLQLLDLRLLHFLSQVDPHDRAFILQTPRLLHMLSFRLPPLLLISLHFFLYLQSLILQSLDHLLLALRVEVRGRPALLPQLLLIARLQLRHLPLQNLIPLLKLLTLLPIPLQLALQPKLLLLQQPNLVPLRPQPAFPIRMPLLERQLLILQEISLLQLLQDQFQVPAPSLTLQQLALQLFFLPLPLQLLSLDFQVC